MHIIVVPDEASKENKGRNPYIKEEDRKRILESLPFVNKAYIDSVSMGLKSIDIVKPDIFCIGRDQSEKWVEELRKKINELGLNTQIIRLDSDKSKEFHTSDLIDS